MIFAIYGLAVLFFGMAFIVTASNAKNLLAGYNTMSDEERSKVDIVGYISFYKKFHIFLSISFLIGGLMLFYLVGELSSGIFIAVYPLLMYSYFLYKGMSYWNSDKNKKLAWFTLIFMLAVVIFVLGMFYNGMKSNDLEIYKNHIHISGMYDTKIPLEEIKAVNLTDSLPQITLRSNGFSIGKYHKGYYKTSKGDKILLYSDSKERKYLHLDREQKPDVYYNSGDANLEKIYRRLRKEIEE